MLRITYATSSENAPIIIPCPSNNLQPIISHFYATAKGEGGAGTGRIRIGDEIVWQFYVNNNIDAGAYWGAAEYGGITLSPEKNPKGKPLVIEFVTIIPTTYYLNIAYSWI